MPLRAYKVINNKVVSTHDPDKCTDEVRELQDLLESDLNLIPGDQINENDPPRWLLVKREMPVQDPSSGDNRWSVDFFLTDHNAFPTFVECKRHANTQSRREVVGQVLEYAANAHYYWDREQLRGMASETAVKKKNSLETEFERLGISDTEDDYFDRVVENLRQGQLRIIFFLEDSRNELRSIVDFLNKQTEFLIVEARPFEIDNLRIVVPTVFGYTEQARQVKRVTTTASNLSLLNLEVIWDKLQREIQDTTCMNTVKNLYSYLNKAGYSHGFGTKSMLFKLSGVQGKTVIAIYIDGKMELYFDHSEGELLKDFLTHYVGSKEITSEISRANKHCNIKWSNWKEHVNGLQTALEHFAEKFDLKPVNT